MPVSLNFRLVTDDRLCTSLGESPVWDPSTGLIWLVDIEGRGLLRIDPITLEGERFSTPEQPGFVVLRGADQPVVGMQTGIFAFNPSDRSFSKLVPFSLPDCRFNDACVDLAGRLWASTMSLDAHPGMGTIHLVDPDLSLRQRVGDLTIPNGMAVDLARGQLYFSDSFRDSQQIWAAQLDGDQGDVKTPEKFASTTDLAGRPDGASFDAAGRYWIAGVDGTELYVFDANGQLVHSLSVPFPAPTKVSFFGKSGRSLAITSKQIGESGGYLAIADLPEDWPSGLMQPYWVCKRATDN